jgi:SAM-dependent methyltransferase
VAAAPFAAAWRAVADAAGIGPGTSLLDLGCGGGAFCAYALRRGATAHGVDADAEAIDRARAEVPEGDFRLGLMESLPWPRDCFDVVTAFNVVQYALDPELALAEARRVARRGGHIAVCKWGRPADNEFFALLIAFGASGVRASELPATDPVEEAIAAVGLDVVGTGDVPAPIRLADDAALEASLWRAAGGALSGDLREAAAPYRAADGSYRFDNRLRYWVLRV